MTAVHRLRGQAESGQKAQGGENSGDDSDAMSDGSEQITQGEELDIQSVRSITQLRKQKKSRTSFSWWGGAVRGKVMRFYNKAQL